ATQIGSEVVLDPSGDRVDEGVVPVGASEEALQVVLDDGVERGGGRLAPAVRAGGGMRWRGDTNDRDRGGSGGGCAHGGKRTAGKSAKAGAAPRLGGGTRPVASGSAEYGRRFGSLPLDERGR